jgi:hypothetical protein
VIENTEDVSQHTWSKLKMAGNYSEDERRVGRGINGNALLWRELQSTYYYIDTTMNIN